MYYRLLSFTLLSFYWRQQAILNNKDYAYSSLLFLGYSSGNKFTQLFCVDNATTANLIMFNRMIDFTKNLRRM
jgi:hypothetical protein